MKTSKSLTMRHRQHKGPGMLPLIRCRGKLIIIIYIQENIAAQIPSEIDKFKTVPFPRLFSSRAGKAQSVSAGRL